MLDEMLLKDFKLTRDPIKAPASRLTEKKYIKVGYNNFLEVRPSIVHFSGFETDKIHVEKIRIVNVSNVSTKLHILEPTTPYFKIKFDKKGLLAAGMSEDITVTFTPEAYKYYYDCIRIHCEEENLLIPIHGYPTIATFGFPRNIKLDPCSVGETVIKTVKMSCNIPIDFEYNISILKSHAQINISPLRGAIPANGEVEIIVSFTPLKMSTAFSEIQITTSQFNSLPFNCTIVGNVTQGLMINTLTKAASTRSSQRLNEIFSPFQSQEINNNNNNNNNEEIELQQENILINRQKEEILKKVLDKYCTLKQSKIEELIPFHTYNKTAPVSALRSLKDAMSDYYSLKASQYNKNNKKENSPNDDEEISINIDGIKIPPNLDSVSALNFVLTQHPGKLKPKDLKKAIAKQKIIRDEQIRIQNSLLKKDTKGGGPNIGQDLIDEERKCMVAGSTRQLRELAFLQEINDIDQMEKKREFASKDICIGSEIMSSDEIKAVELTRKQIAYEQGVNRRKEDLNNWKVEASGHASNPPSRALSEAGYVPNFTPTFDIYQNDVWRKRSKVLQSFVTAGTIIIVRRRVAIRLHKIKQRLGDSKTRIAVRAFVDMENRLARAVTSSSSASNPNTLSNIVGSIQLLTFPEWSESEATIRVTVATETPKKFDNYEMFPLKATKEFNAVGHTELAMPPFSFYFSLENERQMKQGAFEEEGVRASRGSDVDVLTACTGKEITDDALRLSIAAPWLLNPPMKDPLKLILPDTTIRLFNEPLQYDETQADFDLRPKLRIRELEPTIGSLLRETPGSLGACLINNPTISKFWQPTCGNLTSPLEYLGDACKLQTTHYIPPKLEGPQDEDQLSDIESEGEDLVVSNKSKKIFPTMEICQNIFGATKIPNENKKEEYLELDRQLGILLNKRRDKKDANQSFISKELIKLNSDIVDPRLIILPLYDEDRTKIINK